MKKGYSLIRNLILDINELIKLIKAFLLNRKVIYSHYARVKNFGDDYNRDLLRYFNRELLYVKSYKKSQAAFTGSILGSYLRDYDGYILGAGFLYERYNRINNQWKVKILRGPLSAKQCGVENVYYADPGVLAPLIYPETNIKKYKLGIVPNGREAKFVSELKFGENVLVINPHRPFKKVIKEIEKCDYIASSSLHGLIFADSYRIPNVHLCFTDKVLGGNHKFEDYYRGMNVTHESISYYEGISSTEIINNCKLRISEALINEKQRNVIRIYEEILNKL